MLKSEALNFLLFLGFILARSTNKKQDQRNSKKSYCLGKHLLFFELNTFGLFINYFKKQFRFQIKLSRIRTKIDKNQD